MYLFFSHVKFAKVCFRETSFFFLIIILLISTCHEKRYKTKYYSKCDSSSHGAYSVVGRMDIIQAFP